MRTTFALAALALLAGGCTTSNIPSPYEGQTRYLCCNLHYEKPTIADVNFQQGTLVPLGTPVRITTVKGRAVTFEAAGYPPLTAVLKYGRDNLSMDAFVNRLFVERDPRAKLTHLPKKTRELIEAGQVDAGMTRDQVLMALGYPPAHRTPNLDSSQWIYWQNRWKSFLVDFDGDRVDSVRR